PDGGPALPSAGPPHRGGPKPTALPRAVGRPPGPGWAGPLAGRAARPGSWHWSLVDNYEWGSYEPRFGLHGVDRDRGEHGMRWLETDAMGDDAAGAYRRIIAGLRAGDRSVLDPD